MFFLAEKEKTKKRQWKMRARTPKEYKSSKVFIKIWIISITQWIWGERTGREGLLFFAPLFFTSLPFSLYPIILTLHFQFSIVLNMHFLAITIHVSTLSRFSQFPITFKVQKQKCFIHFSSKWRKRRENKKLASRLTSST